MACYMYYLSYATIVCVILNIRFIVAILSTPLEEIDVLRDLYNLNGGINWIWDGEGSSSGLQWNMDALTDGTQDPCLDRWHGVVCSCMDEYYHPFQYSYYYFDTNGTQSYCTIIALNLLYQNLAGNLSPSIINLRNLTILHLIGNSLKGRVLDLIIPNMPNLEYLGLSNNLFTGTVPPSVSNMSHLNRIILSQNHFSGSLPMELEMMNLQALDIRHNHFTGAIPNLFGEMIYLDLSNNSLSGPMPYNFTGDELYYVNIAHNFLTGPLPHFGEAEHLISVAIGPNLFSGNMHLDELSSNMITIQIGDTLCTGSIPSSIGNIPTLMSMSFEKSFLTGSLPIEITMLKLLRFMLLKQSLLSGTLPSDIGRMESLIQVELSDCYLEGRLPESITLLTNLKIFTAKNNRLTGPLLSQWKSMKNLNILLLQNNRLTGTIPLSLFNELQLDTLILQNNLFVGFENEQYIELNDTKELSGRLRVLDVSLNPLRGHLPVYSIFHHNRQSLQEFALVRACIKPFDLISLCLAIQLQLLSLDGSNRACRGTAAESVKYSDYLTDWSNIPQCLMSLPMLETLHLSGLGISGTIPERVVSNHSINDEWKLQDLSLSHNHLTGSIPAYIQQRSWSNLDLSFNKLSGTLSSDFPVTNVSITRLQVNRLSGDVPTSFQSTKHINVLDGNFFDCPLFDADTLPQEDPSTDVYSCGTNSLNLLLYAWHFALLCALVLSGIHICSQQPGREKTQVVSWLVGILIIPDNPGVDQLSGKHRGREVLRYVLQSMSVMFWRLAVVSSCVLLPVYLTLHSVSTAGRSYSTHSRTYAFEVSAVFLSGLPPSLILSTLWLLILVLFVAGMCWVCRRGIALCHQRKVKLEEPLPGLKSVFVGRTRALCAYVVGQLVILLFYSAVFVFMNIGFIYAQSNYGPSVIVYCQIGLVLMELLLNHAMIPLSLRLLHYVSAPRIAPANAISKVSKQVLDVQELQLMLLLTLCASLVAPCVAASLYSSNCFYHAIVDAPSVKTEYGLPYCAAYLIYVYSGTFECKAQEIEVSEASFEPSFVYNFGCSAFLVSSYTSVFVYSYLLSCFGRPFIQYLMLQLQLYVKRYRDKAVNGPAKLHLKHNVVLPDQATCEDRANRSVAIITKAMDIGKDVEIIDEENITEKESTLVPLPAERPIPLKRSQSILSSSPVTKFLSRQSSQLSKATVRVRKSASHKYLMWKGDTLIQTLVQAMSVALSFGLLYPPLLVIVVVALWLSGALSADVSDDISEDDIVVTTKELVHTLRTLEVQLLWLVLPLSALFLSLVVFDILGDMVGWLLAIPLPLLFFVLLVLAVYITSYMVGFSSVLTKQDDESSITNAQEFHDDQDVDIDNAVEEEEENEEGSFTDLVSSLIVAFFST